MKRLRTPWGHPIYGSVPAARGLRRRPRAQHMRSRWCVVQVGVRWYTMWYDRLTGYWWRASRPKGGGPTSIDSEPPYSLEQTTMKRRSVALSLMPVAELPRESVLFRKLPHLVEFLSAVMYEDSSARVPGYYTFRNRGASYEVTLYDPDSGSRLPCNGATIDEAFATAEKLLAAPDTPWVPDRWLMSELAKREPKKKKK